MALPGQDPPEMLRAEILAQARREAGEIIRRAQHEAEALRAQAVAEAERARQARLDQARTEAARRKELILATIPVESGRMRLARLEALLESVHEEVRRRLAAKEGFNYRESLIALAAEAVARMPGRAFVVKVRAADGLAWGDGLAEEIARRVDRSPRDITISNDAKMTESGAIIEDAEGRQIWDNRLLARLERLWPELRREIAVQTSLVPPSDSTGGGL